MRESGDDPNFFVNKGDSDRAIGDFEAALANYHRAAECGASGEQIEKRIAITHYSMARLLLKRVNNRGALFELDKAIEASEAFPDFFVVRAKVRVALGQFEEALDDVFAALTADPQNEEARRPLSIRQVEQSGRQRMRERPRVRRPVAEGVAPYTISELRTRPFDFLIGKRRLPRI
jgi:tetratricopeptide (TPR) repeat protein